MNYLQWKVHLEVAVIAGIAESQQDALLREDLAKVADFVADNLIKAYNIPNPNPNQKFNDVVDYAKDQATESLSNYLIESIDEKVTEIYKNDPLVRDCLNFIAESLVDKATESFMEKAHEKVIDLGKSYSDITADWAISKAILSDYLEGQSLSAEAVARIAATITDAFDGKLHTGKLGIAVVFAAGIREYGTEQWNIFSNKQSTNWSH